MDYWVDKWMGKLSGFVVGQGWLVLGGQVVWIGWMVGFWF